MAEAKVIIRHANLERDARDRAARFMPGRPQLVYIPTPSQVSPEYLWLLDLPSKKARQLSSVSGRSTRTFDITPDGTQIIFYRLKDNSDIVLIDLPQQ